MNPLQSWLKASDSGLRATWLGHSTVLIEIDGFRVLTDPWWRQVDAVVQESKANAPETSLPKAMSWPID